MTVMAPGQGCGRAAGQGRALPRHDQPLTVVLDILGRVGFRAVHQNLHRACAAARQLLVKILLDHQDALHRRIAHHAPGLGHCTHGPRGKPGGMGKIGSKAQRVPPAALIKHGQPQHSRIKRDAVAKEQQKDKGQNPGHKI